MATLLVRRSPEILNHFSQESQTVMPLQIATLKGETIDLSQHSQPLVVVFWATWCGPCQVELNRINQLIKDGEIANTSVLAISSFEDVETIQKTILERDYKFMIGIDEKGDASTAFRVQSTPTIMFIDQFHKIKWISSGLSPLLSFRIQNFLNQR